MKGRFIANGVLSIIEFIGFVMFIAGVVSAAKEETQTSTYTVYNYGYGSYYSSDPDSHTWRDLGYAIAGIIIWSISAFASCVMGIVTLAMINSAQQKGLGIASGVLAVLGGAIGVNAIVSFIGAKKENS